MKGIHGVLLSLMGSLGRMKVRGLPRALVIVLVLLIIGSIFLYWAGWIWLWAVLGRVDLPALNTLLQTLTGASFIAAIGFIGKSLIDFDGDGVPDPWEKEVKENDNEKSNIERHPDDG
jgi:ABC-type Na+ efflux pump permease subunit